MVVVGANSRHGPENVGPLKAVFVIKPQTRLVHLVLARRARALALPGDGVIERDIADVVPAQLQSEFVDALALVPLAGKRPTRFQAKDIAIVRLFELVAVRMVQEKGEVGKQIQLVLDGIGIEVKFAIAERLVPVEREAVALGLAAVGGVDSAEARDLPEIHRALGY